jgi:hypothetical protein
MDRVFRHFRLEYIAPCGCVRLPVADCSVDLVYSRAVLEHLPPSLIEGAFLESRRVLTESGVMCHFIDPSDHLEHRDKRISRIHFLRFSDAVFRLMCLNTLNYHNRMRHSEYAHMLELAGFEIVEQERKIDPCAVVFATTQKLAPRFRQFSLDDLATVDSFFLARVSGNVRNGHQPV